MKQKKGADIINLENQRILDEENYTTDYALQTERERIRYEAELAAAINLVHTTLITAKHALAKEKIEENLASKVAALGASLGIVSDILGKESAGKAAALHKPLLILIKVLQLVSLGIQQLYQQ
jgi:hydrogenase maturation factor HypF (carbamoyltransferase family)